MKLLTKGHSVVAKAASKDETRYILQGVYVEEIKTGMRTTATDGRMMAMVEDESGAFEASEYPANVIPANAPNGAKAAIVPVDAFVKAFKGTSRSRTLPILETVAVTMGKTETTLGTTDLQAPVVRTVTNIDGRFPNCDQIIPQTSEFTTRYNPRLLGRALKIAEDFGLDAVDMEFTGANNPVKIMGRRNGQKLTIVVMPIRSDVRKAA